MVPIFLRTCSHTKLPYRCWASGKESSNETILDPGINFFKAWLPRSRMSSQLMFGYLR